MMSYECSNASGLIISYLKLLTYFGNLSRTYQRNCSGRGLSSVCLSFGERNEIEWLCKKWK